MSSYWKCNKQVSAKLLEVLEERKNVVQHWNNLLKEVGANSLAVSQSWGTRHCIGFVFDEGVPEHLSSSFFKHKEGYWKPRAGTLIRKKMEVQDHTQGEINKLIGVDPMRTEKLGYVNPGIRVSGAYVYLILDDMAEPTLKGVNRISDLTFHRKFTSGKRRQPMVVQSKSKRKKR